MVYFIMIFFTLAIGSQISHNDIQMLKIEKSKLIYNNKALYRNILIFISALGPFLVSAFRYGIGTDYFYTYIPQFKIIANGGESYYEYGFFMLNKIISYFTYDSQWIIIVTSFLFI